MKSYLTFDSQPKRFSKSKNDLKSFCQNRVQTRVIVKIFASVSLTAQFIVGKLVKQQTFMKINFSH